MYFFYILLGSLYFISKVIFYIPGFVCAQGVILGLISTVLTVCVGIFAFKECEGYKKANKLAAHWLAALMPLLILSITPNYMIYKIYLGKEMFSPEKIVIFAIFECLAVAQVILAILMFKDLTFKQGGDKRDISRRGFTLTEMLLVLIILGFFLAMIVPRFGKIGLHAPIVITLNEMKTIKETIRDRFYPDLGLIPYDISNPEWATRYLCLRNDGGVGNPEYDEMRTFVGSTDLMTWNRYSSRGWQGPYMERETSDTPVLADAWFDSEKAEADTSHYYRIIYDESDGRSGLTSEAERLSSRIVSFGANGIDDGGTCDDLVMYIFGTEPIQSP